MAAVHPHPAYVPSTTTTEMGSTDDTQDLAYDADARESLNAWKRATRKITTGLLGSQALRASDQLQTLYGDAAHGQRMLREYENRHAWQKGTILWDDNKAVEKWWQRVLHPYHPARAWWDFAQILALLYVAFLVPFRVGFEHHPEENPFSTAWWLELVVDIYCELPVHTAL